MVNSFFITDILENPNQKNENSNRNLPIPTSGPKKTAAGSKSLNTSNKTENNNNAGPGSDKNQPTILSPNNLVKNDKLDKKDSTDYANANRKLSKSQTQKTQNHQKQLTFSRFDFLWNVTITCT